MFKTFDFLCEGSYEVSRKSFKFGPFVLVGSELRLYCSGEQTALNLKYTSVLYFLVDRAGQILSKDELMESLWADTYVSDSALTQAIKEIRKQLGDVPNRPIYIKTHPKRGYQFIAEVDDITPRDTPPSNEPKPEEQKAREVFERSVVTYDENGFLMEEEALHAVLPLSASWDIEDQGAVLLIKSSLRCGIPIKAWLADKCPRQLDLIENEFELILRKGEPHQKYAALQSMGLAGRDWKQSFLPKFTYTCEDRRLQRMVVHIIGNTFPGRVVELLEAERPPGIRGYVQYMTALALARETSKQHVPFNLGYLIPSIFILLSLAWVRLRRQKSDIALGSLGATIGGGLGTGLLGLALGFLLERDATQLVPVLGLMGLFFGGMGGLFFALGYVSFGAIAHRHSPFWQVFGSCVFVNILGLLFYLGFDALFIDILEYAPINSCGWREITLLCGLISSIALLFRSNSYRTAMATGLAGGLAGFIMNLFGGNLFIRSTFLFVESVGQDGMWSVPPALLQVINPVEGFVFGFCLILGLSSLSKPGSDGTGVGF